MTDTALNFREDIFPPPSQSQIKALDGLGPKIINNVGASISQRAHQTSSYRRHGQDTLSWGNVDKWIDLKFLVGLLENPKALVSPEQNFIIQEIKNIRHVNEIENRYMVRLPIDVQAFLYNHPYITDVIVEAYPYLLDAFSQTFQIQMRVVKDPEIDYIEQLIAYIVTDMSVKQALASLDQFDNRWYLDQLDRLDGYFSFNLDFV